MNEFNLVILPGWGGSHETWRDFVDYASENFANIHVIDLPCFGTKPCPKEVWGVDEYAEFVKKEIARLEFNKIFLLGHSFGGQVAAKFAAKYPDMINKLILSGPAIFRSKFLFRRLFLKIFAESGKIIFKLPVIEKFSILARKILYRTIRLQDYADSSGIKREIFKKIIRQDIRHLLPYINIPTLILWGEKDNYIPLKNGKKIFKLIPNSELYIFKNAGHGLHLHNYEEMCLVIKKFLQHDK